MQESPTNCLPPRLKPYAPHILEWNVSSHPARYCLRATLCARPSPKPRPCSELGVPSDRPVVLVVGGSLGARTVNEAVASSLDAARKAGAFILWQTGKYYAEQCAAIAAGHENTVKAVPFISRMDLAYRAADIVVSRAGAGTISELRILGKSAILIPSPNGAEDHQRKNAEALASRDAAVMILDSEACRELPSALTSLLDNPDALGRLGQNAAKMALHNADDKIVDRIISIVADRK